nr:MAG TPA: hypothetical protein [Caudoviricetes sp.]
MRRIMFTKSQSKTKGSEQKVKQKEKQIIENFAVVIPRLSEADKSYLLGLGEGMAMKVNKNDGKEKNEKE